MMKKTIQQYPDSVLDNFAIQMDRWNAKLEALADTLQHHIRADGDTRKPGSKGVYIDFNELK